MTSSHLIEKIRQFAKECGIKPLIAGKTIAAALKILYDFLKFCDGSFEGMEAVEEAITAIAECCEKLFAQNV